MIEKLRQIHYIWWKEWTKEDLKTYILANTVFFNLWKWEDFEVAKITSPEQLQKIEDETVVLYNIRHMDYKEEEVNDFKAIGEKNEINFVSITL